jgi:NAD(P)-dependent dehydrogenase (short-subunit alcohol dehydrogenase family)
MPTMTERFAGQVALITGASRGIGLAAAQRLVAEGARVCVTARKPDGLAAAVATLGGPAHAIAVAGRGDDASHQAAAVRTAIDAFGRLDVLINNIGINPVYGALAGLDEGAARKIMDVNVLGALRWVREARPAGISCVVNVASIAGLRPSPGLGYYGVSKAALIGLTVQLAAELAPQIRVNAVAPAVVKTRFAAMLYEGHEQEAASRYPLGRLGEPADVAAAVAFLASSDASWITGQTLVIDGGASLAPGL